MNVLYKFYTVIVLLSLFMFFFHCNSNECQLCMRFQSSNHCYEIILDDCISSIIVMVKVAQLFVCFLDCKFHVALSFEVTDLVVCLFQCMMLWLFDKCKILRTVEG